MKKTITFLLLIVAIGVKGQTTVTSKAMGDKIVLQAACFEITPIIVNATGDTARSIRWNIMAMSRDTTMGFNAVVSLYDKLGNPLTTIVQFIPGAVFGKWATLVNKIDLYILNQRKRIIKQ